MAGRGGRGAALLQALEQPARPPGQAGQNGQNVQPSQHQGPAQPGPQGLAQPGPAQYGQRQPYPQQYQAQPYQQRPMQPAQQYQAQAYQQRPMQPFQSHQPYQQQQSQYQQMPGRGQMYGRGSAMYGGPAQEYGQQPVVTPPPQQMPYYGRGAQMASYGRGVPPYGRAAPSVQSDRQPSSQVQEQRSSPPQTQQRGPEVPTAEMARMRVGADVAATQTGEKGTAGKPTSLSSNYIPIRFIERKIYQYHVSYSPEIDSRKERNRLLKIHSDDLLGPASAFDGTILFLPKELEQPFL